MPRAISRRTDVIFLLSHLPQKDKIDVWPMIMILEEFQARMNESAVKLHHRQVTTLLPSHFIFIPPPG
jgi:hypothetical protein